MDGRKIIVNDNKPDKVGNIKPATLKEIKDSIKGVSRKKLVDFALHISSEISGSSTFPEGTRNKLMMLSKGKLSQTIINLSLQKQEMIDAMSKPKMAEWFIFKPIVWLAEKWISRKMKIISLKFFSVYRKTN